MNDHQGPTTEELIQETIIKPDHQFAYHLGYER